MPQRVVANLEIREHAPTTINAREVGVRFTFSEIILTVLVSVGSYRKEHMNQVVLRCIRSTFNHDPTNGEIRW